MNDVFESVTQVIRKHFEGIAEQWNGDEPAGEDRAMIAKEIVEKCAELEALLGEYRTV